MIMDSITLYHGTSLRNAEGIQQAGFFPGRVYLTPRRAVAQEYAYQGDDEEDLAVVEVRVSRDDLSIDNESYDGQDLLEALRTGQSVYASAESVRVTQIISI
jgi:hypothetical protein